MKKKSDIHIKSKPSDDEDFEKLLEEHLQLNPPSPKTEEPKGLNRKTSGKKTGSEIQKIDLHGLNLAEAKDFLRTTWQQMRSSGKGKRNLRIITGKGIHSGAGGPVLVEEIHDFVTKLFGSSISRIDENPSKVRLAGLPLRGHFDVELHIK